MRAFCAAVLLLATVANAQEPAARTEATPVGMFNQHLYYGSFSSPRALAFDEAHRELWVADSGNGLIGIFTEDGAELYAFGSSDHLRDPVRIAIGPTGTIAVIDGRRSHVSTFDYRGRYTGDLPLPQLGPKPILGAVAWDSADNLYIGENRTGQVFMYAKDGKLRLQFGSRGTDEGQFEAICGIAIAGDGLIYVADQQAISVQVFDDQGNFIRGWGKHEMGAENFSLPSGIAIDGAGHVLLSDELRHQVKIFTTAGKLTGQFGGLGTGAGQLSFPTDIAVDAKGRVYVAERGTGRVQVFTLSSSRQ